MSSSDDSGKIVPVKKNKVAKKRKLNQIKAEEHKNNNDENEDSGMIFLGNMRYASVSEFKRKLYVNIREYYKDNSGTMKPGKKGICLNIQQWQNLKEKMDQLDEMIQEKS